jgi:hypothetical protein
MATDIKDTKEEVVHDVKVAAFDAVTVMVLGVAAVIGLLVVGISALLATF